MAADAQSVNWWTVVASSAVIGAVVNNGISLWTRHRDRQREAAATRERQAYARLDVAHALEAFVQRASAYLLALHAALAVESVGQGDAFKHLDQMRLAFEFEPEPVWTDLPIQLVAEVRELSVAFAVSYEGIRAVFAGQIRNAGFYELEAQQTMYYGSLAAELANRIRRDICVAPSALAVDHMTYFDRGIDAARQEYLRTPEDVIMLPALEARFRRELAALPPSDEERLPHEVSAAVAAGRAR
ncbi:hypothetical protein DM48_8000 [Burkholderia gladioli]|uniref:DUF4760 domain-containing protein n=1 Tax=Burkholderia gladioli TaxID=28095 RepID=A0AAW3FBQ8_BURGA|nr:hypothetical protein [Burkholderia gladioli]KGC20359.1 hypothetical protein DM48_8000 [Burkholderia gladioli]